MPTANRCGARQSRPTRSWELKLLDRSVKLNAAKHALAACRNREGRSEATDKKCAAPPTEVTPAPDTATVDGSARVSLVPTP